MRETLEVLQRLEVSREPRIRRQLDHLNARVSLLDRERAGFEQARLHLKSRRDALILAHHGDQPVTGFELHCATAHAELIDYQIVQVLENEKGKEVQLSLARTRAQHAAERLARCLRRQAKLEKAIQRLGKQSRIYRDRQDEEQIDQLSSTQWQRERQL